MHTRLPRCAGPCQEQRAKEQARGQATKKGRKEEVIILRLTRAPAFLPRPGARALEASRSMPDEVKKQRREQHVGWVRWLMIYNPSLATSTLGLTLYTLAQHSPDRQAPRRKGSCIFKMRPPVLKKGRRLRLLSSPRHGHVLVRGKKFHAPPGGDIRNLCTREVNLRAVKIWLPRILAPQKRQRPWVNLEGRVGKGKQSLLSVWIS
jgi:hypothetical protein